MEKRGVAAIAILPSGSISGHFVDSLTSQCFGLFGTQIACERECSRGEDYKLINLSILDFTSKKEVQVIVESHGQDAARFQNAIDIHGWEEDVMHALQRKDQGVCSPSVKFECEILKADEDAEHHIKKYLPSLVGRGAIVNVGTMDIKGLKFETSKGSQEIENKQHTASKADFEAENYCGCNNGSSDDENTQDSRSAPVHDVISVSGKEPFSGCMSSSKEFTEILQEELVVEGLTKHKFREKTQELEVDALPGHNRFRETMLTGWREKHVLPQGSEDSF